MRTVKKCPVCDSTQIQIIDCVREIKVPFAEPVKQKQTTKEEFNRTFGFFKIWDDLV